VVVGGEFGWKYPRLSLAHKLICAGDNSLYHRRTQPLFTGGKVYRRRITCLFARGKNHPGRGGPSPPYPRRTQPLFVGGKSSIPGAYGLYAPGINIPMCLPSLCGPPRPYRWRIHELCANDNSLSPANNRLCAKGNITTGELLFGAPAIGLPSISNSLLVSPRQVLPL
jgi:hypothetical protein